MSHEFGVESKRYEIKMTCDERYLADVRSWVRLHPDAFLQAYTPRQVNTIYLDTPQAQCLEDNLIGAQERTKLRFRWYGTHLAGIVGHLELKHKINQLGWKEHCPIPTPLDLTTLSWPEFVAHLQAHASGNLALWLSRIERPTLLNSYQREYYESNDRRIRLTIDHDQRVYEQVTSAAPNLCCRAPIESTVVVEVKADTHLHRRVSNALLSLPMQVERNSKYVNGLLGSLV